MSRLGVHKKWGISAVTVVLMACLTAGVTAWQTPAWAPNTAYAVNQQVTHTGNTYRCIQAHTSIVGWEPPIVPALWERGATPPPNCTTAPSVPAGLASPSRTAASVNLGWNAASPGANCTITGYQIFRDGVLATTTSGTGTNFTITGLTANTTYRFAVAAVNQFGASARSGEISVTTNATGPTCSTVPGIPTSLSSPSKTSASVALAWNAAPAGANCTITGYQIFRDGTLVATTSGTGVSHTVTGLTPNTAYRFNVAAVNQFGASAQSAAVMVTTSPGATGAPARPVMRIEKWQENQERIYDVIWEKHFGIDATSWQVFEDGQLIHTANIAPAGGGLQSARFRVSTKTYGAFVYQVVLGNSAGSTAGDPQMVVVGDASKIRITGADSPQQATQLTVNLGANPFSLNLFGVANPNFSLSTNNRSVVGFQVNGSAINVQGLASGRASLRIEETSTGAVRYVGVRVRTASGGLPGLPNYVSVGSVSEDTAADLGFWRSFSEPLTNKRMDIRYIYINGGPVNGWRTWTSVDGFRAVSFVRESKKLGMIPFFVYYNIPDGSESYQTDKEHIESGAYVQAYFRDLKFFLDLVRNEGGDEMVGIVFEPDFLGYMMQNSNGRTPTPADQLLAITSAAYDSGVLSRTSDPIFPNTIRGLVQAINYTTRKYAPSAYFGWQFNLWASPGVTVNIPSNGLMRLTDAMGIANGRNAIRQEAQQIARYYLNAGIATNGANFVSIDKYGLDAAATSEPNNPTSGAWFWNADHWNNYLLFCQVLRQESLLPVVLWQIPIGRINTSQSANPYTGGMFPPLNNSVTHYEDSAPTFFLGDIFRPGGAARLNHFRTNQGADPKITSSGDTVTWGAHMQEARDNGVIAILFGAGVGASTDGVGSPPTDDYWWITQVQRYYLNPAPRN